MAYQYFVPPVCKSRYLNEQLIYVTVSSLQRYRFCRDKIMEISCDETCFLNVSMEVVVDNNNSEELTPDETQIVQNQPITARQVKMFCSLYPLHLHLFVRRIEKSLLSLNIKLKRCQSAQAYFQLQLMCFQFSRGTCRVSERHTACI